MLPNLLTKVLQCFPLCFEANVSYFQIGHTDVLLPTYLTHHHGISHLSQSYITYTFETPLHNPRINHTSIEAWCFCLSDHLSLLSKCLTDFAAYIVSPSLLPFQTFSLSSLRKRDKPVHTLERNDILVSRDWAKPVSESKLGPGTVQNQVYKNLSIEKYINHVLFLSSSSYVTISIEFTNLKF
jgi:hypothetical protein